MFSAAARVAVHRAAPVVHWACHISLVFLKVKTTPQLRDGPVRRTSCLQAAFDRASYRRYGLMQVYRSITPLEDSTRVDRTIFPRRPASNHCHLLVMSNDFYVLTAQLVGGSSHPMASSKRPPFSLRNLSSFLICAEGSALPLLVDIHRNLIFAVY